jgi:hypothetical protein
MAPAPEGDAQRAEQQHRATKYQVMISKHLGSD